MILRYISVKSEYILSADTLIVNESNIWKDYCMNVIIHWNEPCTTVMTRLCQYSKYLSKYVQICTAYKLIQPWEYRIYISSNETVTQIRCFQARQTSVVCDSVTVGKLSW